MKCPNHKKNNKAYILGEYFICGQCKVREKLIPGDTLESIWERAVRAPKRRLLEVPKLFL